MHRQHRTAPVATTRTRKPSLFSRLMRPRPAASTATTAHHRRKPSIGDRISGALMRLRGSVTGRPGVKAAGTRRMRGTDGRGSTVKTRRRL